MAHGVRPIMPPQPSYRTVQLLLPIYLHPEHVRITIFDVLGRQVCMLMNEIKQPGAYRVTWDIKDKIGNQALSGLYFVHLQADAFEATRKLLLTK
jgi:hypothetical protein